MERIYRSWQNQEGIPSDLVDPEAEWVNPSDAIEPGTRHGPEGVRGALANFSSAYRVISLEVERIVADRETVTTSVNLTFEGRGSGIEVHNQQAHRFTLRNGKVTRFEWSSNPDDLLAPVEREASED